MARVTTRSPYNVCCLYAENSKVGTREKMRLEHVIGTSQIFNNTINNSDSSFSLNATMRSLSWSPLSTQPPRMKCSRSSAYCI